MLMPRWRITSDSVAPSMGSTTWSVQSFTCRLQHVRLPRPAPASSSPGASWGRSHCHQAPPKGKQGTKTPAPSGEEGRRQSSSKDQQGGENLPPSLSLKPKKMGDCQAHLVGKWNEGALLVTD